MRHLIIAILIFASCGWVCADDIVSMPTANQLKAGEVDVAAYYFGLENPTLTPAGAPTNAPQNVNLQTVNVGLTDKIEIDAYRADVDKDKTAAVVTGYFRLLSETPETPDVVVGVKNIFGTETTNVAALAGKSGDRSYFICAARTFFLSPAVPQPPLVRVHLSLGSADWTLFNAERHKGIFGGLQFLFKPDLGAVVQNDGCNWITGVTYMPKNTGLTIKGGGFGEHWWAGLAYRKALAF
jgi:hypothetical protein